MTTKKKTAQTGEKLSTAIPVRLKEGVKSRLKDYEKGGLNSAELIRRCLDKSLDDVVREMIAELAKIEERK